MATEPGNHHTDYDPNTADAVLAETAFLLRHLGFAAEHTVVIGGLVPTLLIIDPHPMQAPHIGSTDVDFCLSVAFVEGDTAEYERIERALSAAGYAPTEDSFCWRCASRLRLRVEFFCPAGDDRPAGALFRPKHATNPVAKHNLGGKLSAIALDGGNIVAEDVMHVTREVILPEDGGRTNVTFRVTGLLGFLVSKVAALVGRDKAKDAYDIVWLLENWPDGPHGAATAAKANPLIGRPEVEAAFARLATEFATTDGLGPSSYVRFVSDPEISGDERARLARQAVGAVSAFISVAVPSGTARLEPG